MARQLKLSEFTTTIPSLNKLANMQITGKTVKRSSKDPKTVKLETLDHQLSAIANTSNEPLEKRLRNFEETLNSYQSTLKQLQQGGVGGRFLKKRKAMQSSVKSLEGVDDEALARLLAQKGVIVKNNRVHFPLRRFEQKRRKHRYVSYKVLTVAKVVDFLLNGPRNISLNGLIRSVSERIYHMVRGELNLDRYPGLQKIEQDVSANFNGQWARL